MDVAHQPFQTHLQLFPPAYKDTLGLLFGNCHHPAQGGAGVQRRRPRGSQPPRAPWPWT